MESPSPAPLGCFEVWKPETLGECKYDNACFERLGAPEQDDYVLRSSEQHPADAHNAWLERVTARRKIFWNIDETFTCGITTCGGLCPGLNSVIRSLVITLWYSYGVRNIKGFKYGYEGLSAKGEIMMLTPDVVTSIHHFGGSLIGTSRGPQNVHEMVDCLEREKISVLFTIGGDGTLRGANAVCDEISRRHLSVCVLGVPKTIDNDIPLMQRTFGFNTAVSRAVEAIASAHCEAFSHRNGVALVKLMGRDSGFIALEAAIASGDVNLCLIPEAPFDVDVVIEYVRVRLATRGHCVIVIAEGAGQSCFGCDKLSPPVTDASGNVRFIDVGVELKKELEKQLKDLDPTVKYIDPSYMIRSAPANAGDEKFCVTLAQGAVHAAMAGRTRAAVASVGGGSTMGLLPLDRLHGRKHVDVEGSLYSAMLSNIGQPRKMTRK